MDRIVSTSREVANRESSLPKLKLTIGPIGAEYGRPMVVTSGDSSRFPPQVPTKGNPQKEAVQRPN